MERTDLKHKHRWQLQGKGLIFYCGETLLEAIYKRVFEARHDFVLHREDSLSNKTLFTYTFHQFIIRRESNDRRTEEETENKSI